MRTRARQRGARAASLLVAAVLLALPALPREALAQASGAAHRIGVIHQGGVFRAMVDGLRQALGELGLEEGKQIVLDVRDAQGDLRAVEAAARDLEEDRVALLYTVGTSVTLAAKRSTTATPIVFFAGNDPVVAGLVESLAQPGGRLTGVHGLSGDLTARRMQLLKEIIPDLGSVVTFYDPDNPVASRIARIAARAAQQAGVKFVERHVDSTEELRLRLATLRPRQVDAFFYVSDAMVTAHAQLIIEAAKAKGLPTMFHEDSLVAKGALASYGPSFYEIGRMSAKHVQRVLAGAQPANLPVEIYDKTVLAINLRTAQQIGVSIPPAVLARAAKVVD